MEKILFNGRPASQMILNGDVIWTAIDLSHHVYYSIDNSSTTDTLTTQVDGKYIYLPNMDTEFSAIQVSIIGQTNTEVVDLEGAANILVSDVDQLRVYFPKNTTYVKFNGGSHRIKKLLHCDTGNLTDMESMFNGCTYLEYVTLLGWDTSNVRYISRLFNGCKNLKSITDLENLNFSGLTADEWGDEMGIWAMFNNCTSLTSLDLSSWDTSNVKYMTSTFNGCSALTTLNISSWDTSNLTSLDNIFSGCTNLLSLDLSNWDTSKVTAMRYAFSNCTSLTSLDLSNWDTSNVEYMNGMFSNISTDIDWNYDGSNYTNFNLTELQTGYSGSFPWRSPYYVKYNVYGGAKSDNLLATDSSGNYKYLPLLGYISLDIPTDIEILLSDNSVLNDPSSAYLDEVKTIRVNYTEDTKRISFANTRITSIDYIKTDNLIYMYSMFDSCMYLYSLDISGWNTSNVTTIAGMFNNCTYLEEVNVSNIDTSKVKYMTGVFSYCSSLLSLDLSSWDTSNVTDMINMFNSCSTLASLNLNNWDTSNVTDMNAMFYACQKLTSLDLSHWITDKVTRMSSMFFYCNKLTSLNISNFNTVNVSEYSHMFDNIPSTVDWHYSGSNYLNFTLTESQTGFNGTFPWNIEPLIIDYTADTTLPTYPSWFTRTDSGSTGHFNFVTTSDLVSGGQLYCGYGTNSYHNGQSQLRFNVTPDADMMMRITGYVSGNGDYLYVNCKKNTDTSYTTYYSSSYGYPFTTTINLESGNTYNLYFLYSKDESDEEQAPGASITKIEFFYLEPPVETPDSYLIDWETTNPTLPSWITPHQVSTSYSFSRDSLTYNSVTYTGLVPNNRGVKSKNTIAWNCYKVVAPLTGTLEVSLTNYAEGNYDFTSVYLTQFTSQPNATAQSSGCLFFGKGKQSSAKQTGTISVTAGTTYYLHFLYRKDTSGNAALDAGVIHSIKVY